MLTDFKFLTSAISRKDFTEALTHFHIHNGNAWSFDGAMSMHTLTDVKKKLTVRPHASSFVRAIVACDNEGAIDMDVTATGRLAIKSGKFRAYVKCLDENQDSWPIPKPREWEEKVIITEDFLTSMKELAPFMSIDASRPWAQGLRIFENKIHATNNIILIERTHQTVFPFEIIMPSEFVKAIIGIDQIPIEARVSESSLAFIFEDDRAIPFVKELEEKGEKPDIMQLHRWIRTQLVVGKWPGIDTIFERVDASHPVAKPLPDDFFPALEQLKSFLDDRGRVFIYPDKLSTSNIEGEGAAVDIDTGLEKMALFHLEQLLLLQPIMTSIDLSHYPNPAPFYGDDLRGVIVGQRETENQ